MDKLIELLFSLGYAFHPQETRDTLIKTYVQNYNGVRHWVRIYAKDTLYGNHKSGIIYDNDAVEMFSFREGTGDTDPIITTGIVENPSKNFITEWVNKSKKLM